MWSVRDPDARKSGIGNLFVKVHSINGFFLIHFVRFYSFVVMSFWKCIDSYFYVVYRTLAARLTTLGFTRCLQILGPFCLVKSLEMRSERAKDMDLFNLTPKSQRILLLRNLITPLLMASKCELKISCFLEYSSCLVDEI